MKLQNNAAAVNKYHQLNIMAMILLVVVAVIQLQVDTVFFQSNTHDV